MAFARDVGGTRSASGSAVNTHAIALPTWVLPGHLMIAYVSVDQSVGATTETTPTGWTTLATVSSGAVVKLRIWMRVVDGTEGTHASFETDLAAGGANADVETSHIVRVYEGHSASDNGVSIATATGSASQPDCPNLAPAAGSDDWLWVACFAMDENATNDSTPPANYPNAKRVASSSDSGFSTIHYTCRQATGSSENPGAFAGMNADHWASATLSIPPGDEGLGNPPIVTTTNTSVESSTTTTHDVSLPASLEIDNLVIVKIVTFNSGTLTWPAGWTSLVSVAVTNQVRVEIRWRVVDGTEGSTIQITSSGAVQSAHQSWQIANHDEDIPPTATTTSSFSTIPRPPNHTLTSSQYDTLIIAGFGASDDDDASVYWPVSLLPLLQNESSAAGSSCLAASTTGILRNQSSFALDVAISDGASNPQQANAETMRMAAGENWAAYTIAIYGILDGFEDEETFTPSTLIHFRPEEMRQQLAFSTSVLRAYDGSEQRIGMRSRPRRTYEVEYSLRDEADVRYLHKQFLQGFERRYDLPRWGEEIRISNEITAGATSIIDDFEWSEYAQGTAALLMSPGGETYEVVTLASFSSDRTTLVLDDPVVNDYPVGSSVVPIEQVYIADEATLERYRNGGARVTITATARLQRPLFTGDGDITLEEYDNLIVLEDRHLSTETNGQEFDHGIFELDFGNRLIPIATWDPAYASITEIRRFVVPTLEERALWNLLATTLHGSMVTFLAPTWREDLVLNAQPATGASTIVITDEPGYNSIYEGAPSHDYLQLETDAGIIYRKVNSAVDNLDGTHTLTLDTALPGTVPGSTINRISFLERVRMSSDVVTYQFAPGGFSTITIGTRTVHE